MFWTQNRIRDIDFDDSFFNEQIERAVDRTSQTSLVAPDMPIGLLDQCPAVEFPRLDAMSCGTRCRPWPRRWS